jgi:lia operon protein LiaG
MRSLFLRSSLLAAVLGVSVVPVVGSAQEKATLSGSEVAIYNLVGSIKAVGGGSGDVAVTIAKSGKDAAQLRVEQGNIRGRETLRVIYPARRITFGEGNGWGGRTTLRVADDGTFDDNDDDGSRVEISGRSGGLEARADLTVTVPAGKEIHLHLAAGDVTVTNVNGDVSVGVDAADVTTSGTRGALTLDTGSGTVQITDAQGDVSIDCGSGPVTLSRIRGERLSVDAGSGRMRGDGIDSKRIDLDLGSGGAVLKNVTTTDLKLDSGSGSTEIDLASDIDRLDIDSGSGGVTLWIPATLGAKVDIDAGSGGIDMGVPVSVTRYESDHVVGTIGDGRGTIRIDAGSGGVHLRKRG